MKEQEINELLENPQKLLDLIRGVHRLLHAYEAKELMKSKEGTKEKIGLNDNVDVKVFKGQNKSEEVK